MLELDQQHDHINLRISTFDDNYEGIGNSYVHFQFDNRGLSFRKFVLVIDVTVQTFESKEKRIFNMKTK